MNKKEPWCSPDVDPEPAPECYAPDAIPEAVKEEVISQKPILDGIGMEDEPLDENVDGG